MKHISVLKDEALSYLNIKPDGIYVDCTLGGGGHAEAILSRLTSGKLIAFDQDPYAVERANARLQEHADKLIVIEENFVHLKEALEARSIGPVDGILYDLGVSSFHFDDPERGFSYNHDAPLDMRMDTRASLTAKELVNTLDAHALKTMFYRYAEERFAGPIAKAIVTRRQSQPIETTFELVEVIKSALPMKVLSQKGHPAKRVFQALRIAVNDELRVFEESLKQALACVGSGGRIVVISFHSLEDRIAKHVFRDATTIDHPPGLVTMPEGEAPFELLTRKVVRPSEDEVDANPRASSAKLRAVKKR